MKNPIYKRIPRLYLRQPGRYLPIFILLLITIVIISAFFIVQVSVEKIYHDFMKNGKVEDGQFTTIYKLSSETRKNVEKQGVRLYENFYVDVKYGESIIQFHKDRRAINIAHVIEGRLPAAANEIALDYNYTKANKISLGSELKFDSGTFKLVGQVVMPDYNSMIKNRNDLVMDTLNFGAGIVNETGFERISTSAVQYCYAYHEIEKSPDKKTANDKLKTITTKVFKDNILTDAMTKAQNKRISYLIDDMGGDVPMITMLLAIIMVSIAFIFTVQSRNLIEEEASVIGTLMASGYSRRELILHYMLLPVIAVLSAGIIGNVLTYTRLYSIFTGLYYDTFSLPEFVPLFNARAFVMTTVVPALIILLINLITLISKLRMPPLRFLRQELSRRKNRKHHRSALLPQLAFIKRFRVKVLLDNKLNVFVLIVGITLANILFCFGLGFTPIFNSHAEAVKNELPAKYQTFIRNADGMDEEKFAACSFELEMDGETHPFMLTGIADNSRYYDNAKLQALRENEIMASDGLLKKFGLNEGDSIRVVNPYTNEKYQLTIRSIYEKGISLAAYMTLSGFNKMIGYDADFFSGYLSDEKLNIDSRNVIAQIGKESLDKAMAHFLDTFGVIRGPIIAVSLVFYFVFIYMLAKMIIEKSKTQISYLKIFGFTDKENSSIYLDATGIAVTLYLLISPFLMKRFMVVLMRESMKKFDSYMAPYLPAYVYIMATITGIVLFLLIQKLQTRRISKINMVEVLKDVTG